MRALWPVTLLPHRRTCFRPQLPVPLLRTTSRHLSNQTGAPPFCCSSKSGATVRETSLLKRSRWGSMRRSWPSERVPCRSSTVCCARARAGGQIEQVPGAPILDVCLCSDRSHAVRTRAQWLGDCFNLAVPLWRRRVGGVSYSSSAARVHECGGGWGVVRSWTFTVEFGASYSLVRAQVKAGEGLALYCSVLRSHGWSRLTCKPTVPGTHTLLSTVIDDLGVATQARTGRGALRGRHRATTH
eukprot:920368-Prymnesium_polylepis.1